MEKETKLVFAKAAMERVESSVCVLLQPPLPDYRVT